MSTWWAGLAPRERALVAIAAIMTVVVALWQFVLVPARQANAAARAELAAADLALVRIQEAYVRQRAFNSANTSGFTSEAIGDENFKLAITQAAGSAGLSIDRLQTVDGFDVRLVIERADPRLVFFWLEDVQTRFNGQASRLTLEQAGEGRVRVNVDLVPGG